jgi:hypothetical protein
MAIIPLMIVNRLNMNAPTQHRSSYPANQGVFKPAGRGRCRPKTGVHLSLENALW